MSQTPAVVRARIDGPRIVRRVILFWLALEILLVVLDTVVNYNRLTEVSQFRRMANIAREDGIATWFSSMQLMLVSVSLWLVTWRVRRAEPGRWRARGWGLVALFFAYLSFDDGAKVHERVATGVKKLFADGRDMSEVMAFFPSYAWQVIFLPVFGGMGLFMAVFFWREIQKTSTRLLVAAALGCYVIAVGLDFIEGLEQGYEDVAEMLGVSMKFAEHYGRVLEEFLEMFGTTLFLGAFLGHFLQIAGRLDLTFGRGTPEEEPSASPPRSDAVLRRA